MPNTVELINPDQLATLVGKSYAVRTLGGGKASITPLTPAAGSQVVPAKIMLKGVEVEGLQAAKAAAAQQAGAAKAGAGAQTLIPVRVPLVEIEGAGKTVGAGKSTTVLSLQTQGIMKAGGTGTIDLLGGEAKITTAAPKTTLAKAATPAQPVAAQATVKMQTVAMNATTGGTSAKGIAIGGTLAKSSGLGLLGLAGWGPVLLAGLVAATVGVGVYNYIKRQQTPAT